MENIRKKIIEMNSSEKNTYETSEYIIQRTIEEYVWLSPYYSRSDCWYRYWMRLKNKFDCKILTDRYDNIILQHWDGFNIDDLETLLTLIII